MLETKNLNCMFLGIPACPYPGTTIGGTISMVNQIENNWINLN